MAGDRGFAPPILMKRTGGGQMRLRTGRGRCRRVERPPYDRLLEREAVHPAQQPFGHELLTHTRNLIGRRPHHGRDVAHLGAVPEDRDRLGKPEGAGIELGEPEPDRHRYLHRGRARHMASVVVDVQNGLCAQLASEHAQQLAIAERRVITSGVELVVGIRERRGAQPGRGVLLAERRQANLGRSRVVDQRVELGRARLGARAQQQKKRQVVEPVAEKDQQAQRGHVEAMCVIDHECQRAALAEVSA